MRKFLVVFLLSLVLFTAQGLTVRDQEIERARCHECAGVSGEAGLCCEFQADQAKLCDMSDVGGSVMAYENFSTGWTETDPSSRLTQTATRSTWTGLVLNSTQYLLKDDLVSLNSDFDIAFDARADSSSDGDYVPYAFILSDDYVLSNPCAVPFGEQAGTGKLYVGLSNNTASNSDDTLSLDTVYYFRLQRDDDGGTGANSLITLKIYGSAADRASNSSVLVTLSLDTPEHVTYILLLSPLALDEGRTEAHTGYLENLDLAYVPSSEAGGIMTTRTNYWGDL